MRKKMSVLAAVAVAALGVVVILGASPQGQEEPKADRFKAFTEKIEKLEKRVADLDKKVAELEKKLADRKSPAGGVEDKFKSFLDKFGGNFEGGKDGFKKLLEEFRGQVPEMPDFNEMPDLFQGMDAQQLLDMLKDQFGGELPGFFDGLDMEGLFDQFKEKLEKRSDPEKKKSPKRRSI